MSNKILELKASVIDALDQVQQHHEVKVNLSLGSMFTKEDVRNIISIMKLDTLSKVEEIFRNAINSESDSTPDYRKALASALKTLTEGQDIIIVDQNQLQIAMKNAVERSIERYSDDDESVEISNESFHVKNGNEIRLDSYDTRLNVSYISTGTDAAIEDVDLRSMTDQTIRRVLPEVWDEMNAETSPYEQ